MTLQELIDGVFYRVAQNIAEPQAGLYRFYIESWVDDAINRLAESVAKLPHFALLQKNFTGISLSSGIGLLPPTMVIESIPTMGEVLITAGTTATIYPLQYLPHIQDLKFGGRSQEWEYYAIRGNAAASSSGAGAIFVYKGDGIPTSATAVSIRANYYPAKPSSLTGSFTDLPAQLENDLKDMAVMIAREKMGAMQNAEMAAPSA